MTPLRQRMIEDMQLRGFSARTQECYVAAVRQLAQHYHRSPDQFTEEDLSGQREEGGPGQPPAGAL
ncbi:phage integrase N-terminal SAM-like domain-containing protein [Acidobacteria bacterium AH-259-L09]|nr:phage integrase N-terminal SAM-like domain-containing protein [Acidobacteria bacterium AH-259-L09]